MTKKVRITIVVLVVLGVLYYSLSPLFRNVQVYDEAPVSAEKVQMNEEAVREPVTFTVVDTPSHPASGSLSVLESEGKTYVRYENYKTINGPDLFVYLSKDLDAKEFVNLGELRGTEGNINYEVPDNVTVEDYRYVLTWCKQFGVLFNYVDIGEYVSNHDSTDDTKKEEDKDDTMKKNVGSDASREGMDESVEMRGEGEAVEIGDLPEKAVAKNEATIPSGPKTAVMGTGCFWCVEHDFAQVRGVLNVVSGYAGGTGENPTYENYAHGGYREVVEVTYDPSIVSYGNLVEHAIKYGDPTDPDGSFGDRGKYYAPVIQYANDAERDIALKVIAKIDMMHVYPSPITIDVVPSAPFFPAEEYHQDYAEKNPLRYNFYRSRSGRSDFIEKYWGENAGDFVASESPELQALKTRIPMNAKNERPWETFVKPDDAKLKEILSPLAYEVTQEDGTERSRTSPYDKLYERGIYVDVVSGEPLFFSRDKYDSGTGWPSFVKPISDEAVTLHEDRKLFSVRTEVRSRYADSHLGHVFDDGPSDRGGKRYCMNGVALRFIPEAEMKGTAYEYLLTSL